MNKRQNELLVKIIKESIPENVNPILYLINFLKLSSESVYRRIRGSVSFTFEEIARLATDLNFSVDEIIGLKNPSRKFLALQNEDLNNPSKSVLNMLEQFFNYQRQLSNSAKSEIIISINKIHPLLVLNYNYLFKFFYFKWIKQTGNTPLNYSFSDISIPKEINHALNKIKSHQYQLMNNNITVIFDPFVFCNTIKEINYYYKRGLITEN
jgi:hypothetical protein